MIKRKEIDWQLVKSNLPHKFLPFSRYVFLDMNRILVLGGLDDTHQSVNDFFTNYVYELSILKFNTNEDMYVCNAKSAMMTGRGCFGVCHVDNFVYAFGDVIHSEPSYIQS